jgi:uncharacterized protein (DUF1697 family)
MKTASTDDRDTCQSEMKARIEDGFCRQVASLLSRGNIALQAGCFETKEDLDARWEKLKNYEF